MATKVIKLKENSNTLIPVTDAKIVQMTYDGTTYSVHDVILDTEEAIATTYNHLSSRIENLEYYADNPPLLNTDNSNSLTTSSAEEIDGTIDLHKISKTGSWNDLLNKPTIPAAQVKSNWTETNTSSMAYILNKPDVYTKSAINTLLDEVQPISVNLSYSAGSYSFDTEISDIESVLSMDDRADCTVLWDGDSPDILKLRLSEYNAEKSINGTLQSCNVWRAIKDDYLYTTTAYIDVNSGDDVVLFNKAKIKENVVLGYIDSITTTLPRVNITTTTYYFYRFLGTFTETTTGTPPIVITISVPDYSSTPETCDTEKIYVDIETKKAYWYNSEASTVNNITNKFVEISPAPDLSNYYTKSETNSAISSSVSSNRSVRLGYLNESGDFYEAYWSSITANTSYYLPAVNQSTLSYANNLYIDINTGKSYRYKNGTLGSGETRFDEIAPPIAKEKIIRIDRKSFRASNGTAINMESKYFYIFGGPYVEEDPITGLELDYPITRLEIASLVNSYDDSKYENDFHGMVYCQDTTFSLPNGIKIANDGVLPAMEYNYIFEFHILNGILTFTYTRDTIWE